MRGSAMTLRLPSSRAAREGQTIQENTTVSPGSAFTAMKKSVSLPAGMSLPQHSTTCKAPCSLKMGAAHSASLR
jgi:hypothetical protein